VHGRFSVVGRERRGGVAVVRSVVSEIVDA